MRLMRTRKPGFITLRPVRKMVTAHFADHGHSMVTVKPGLTVREALSKAMKLRKLTPETCAVFKLDDPRRVRLNIEYWH